MKINYARILLLGFIAAILFFPSFLIGQNAGNIDPSFHYGKGTGWDYSLSNSSAYHSVVQDAALLSDGKIVFGTNLSMDFMHGVRRKALAKINSNGSVDLNFAGPTSINNVTKVYPLSDGKFIMFGTGLGRNALARYNADGTYDNTWNPAGGGPNDTRLWSLAFQADGKMIIGGIFTTWNGATANRIVRLNADGTLDATFVGNINASVREIKILSSGKILIGGDFTQVSGVTKNYFALLNSDGSLDNTFPASSGVGPNNSVNTIVPLSDGKILISGTFTTYNGTSRNRLFRINADGSPDATFTQTLNAFCPSLMEVSGGKYIAVTNGSVNRLNSNGTTDGTFTQVVPTIIGSPSITKGILQPDGKILVFGQFSKLNNVPADDVARINADGTIDATFNELVGANSITSGFQVTSDGKIYVSGSFDGINGNGRGFFVRLNSDGSNDAAYNSGTGPNNGANDVAIDPTTGKAVIVGQFTSVNSTTRTRIARFNTDGTLDATFAPSGGLNNQVNNVVVQSDGKIIVGGSFTQANGTNIGRIARFNTDGTVDATFATNVGSDGFSDQVLALALQADGKIIVAGYFLTYKGVSARNICRLNADGTRDASFASPSATITPLGVTVQADGKIIVTGQFSSYSGTSRSNITRLNSDGSNDASFVIGTGFNQLTRRSVLTSDGKILVSGNFTTFNGITRTTIARLKSNGNIDQIFNPGAGTFGSSGGGAVVGAPGPLALTPAGDIIMGGDFLSYQGKATAYFTKIQGTGCGNLAAPTITLSGGVATFCSPGTRTLTASAGAGYLWSNGATTQAINVTESGSYTCQIIDETCTSAASAPTVITVTQTPSTPTITGNNTYCSGGSTILTSSSGTAYLWSNGATTQSINVISAGNFSVRIINGTCTSAVSNTITVTSNPTTAPNAPSISGPTTVCSGSNISLFQSYGLLSNEAYLWSDNSSGSSLTVTTAGTYSLRIRNTTTGCTSLASNSITVTQNPSPVTPTISGTRTFTTGSSTTLTSSSATGNLWSNGETTQSISVNSPGTYTLRVTNGSCTSAVVSATVSRLTNNYAVSVLAGSGTAGLNNATGTAAQFNDPWSICKDAAGNFYVAESGTPLIRKITPAGVVTTFAGSGVYSSVNGTGTAASFNAPVGIASDNQDNLYVAEFFGHRIRKITPAGVVSTFAGGTSGIADGTGEAAQFTNPSSVAVGPNGNIYVTDQNNHRIRQITPAGVVSTLAGSTVGFADGTGSSAQFNTPTGIAVDYEGNIYVTDHFNNRIRKITPAGVVSTFAGNGTGSSTDGTGTGATIHNPRGIVIDGSGTIYVSDQTSNKIRRITNPGAVVTTIGGGNTGISVPNSANSTTFNNPTGLTIDANGVIYQAELGNDRILKLTPCSNIAAPTISGSNVVCSGNTIVLTSSSATGNIWSTGETTQSITVSSAGTYSVLVASNGCASATTSIVVTGNTTPATPTISGTRTFTSGGSTTLTSSSATGNLWSNGETTQSISVNSLGTYTLRVTNGSCTSAVVSATVSRLTNNYSVSVLAGSGTGGFNNATGTAAQFRDPWGICKDAAGNFYTTDPTNARIRKITPAGVVTTFAGSGTSGNTNGIGTAASFNGSIGIASDNQDNLYVTEYFGQSIRKITPAGEVSTFAGGTGGIADGTGAAAQFNNPTSVAVGPNGMVYVTDQTNNRIRQITPAGVVTTLAGSSSGYADGTGSSAQFSAPTGIAVDYNGNIFVADYYNNRIRKITPAGVVTTFAGSGTASSTDGTGIAATFHSPRGIVIDGSGTLFVTCEGTDRIRRITNPGAVVTTIAGANSGISVPNSANSYIFNNPVGLTIDANGVIYQAELSSPRILKLTPCSDIAAPTISGSNVICNGTPIVLTSSSATGNIWSNGETTQSITVSGEGTYSVLVASNGCASATASIVVTATDLRTNPRTILGFTYLTTIGSKDYYKSNSPTTWSAARTNCISAGGDLASLETEAEWTAVRTAAGNSEFLWIGLSDATVEGQFQWVSGNPFNYVLWNSGEPNNYGGDEDYVGLVSGLANDFSTNNNLNAILEVSQTSTAFSNSPVIAGNSLTFSAPTVAGATYAWTGPNGFTSTTQNPTISAASSAHTGNFSLTISLNGCTRSITLPVVVTCENAVRKAPRTLSGFTYGGSFGKKDYYVSNGFATWDAARTACQTAGGDLVSIETAAEWNVVKTVASTDVWIGLSDAATEGTFQWVSGAPTTFTSWNSSEPNNFGNNEDHVIIRSSSTTGWNDFPSTQSQRYILEIDQEQFTASNSPISAGSQLTFTTATTANTTYSWSGPNGYSSTAQSPSITVATPQNAGQYILTSTRLGCERKDTIQVVVNCPVITTPTISGTASFCVGGSTVLTSSSSNGYIWSNGATTQSITVSLAGSYTVRTIVNGCTSAISNSVAVTLTDFRPTPRTISGFTYSRSLGNKDYYISNSTANWTSARAACVAVGGDLVSIETETEWNTVVGINTASNSWIGLTDAAQEGTFRWVTGELPTYTFWHPGNPDNYAGNEDYVGILTGAPYYWNDFSGNENHLYILEVSQQTFVTSNSPVTAGTQLTFTTATTANTTYSWTGPNGYTSTAQSPVITVATPQNAGQYILTSTRLGCEKKDTLQVVVNCPAITTPTISGATAICSGSSTSLTTSYALGTNEAYLWSDNSSAATLSVSVAGTYTQRIINLVTGCTSAVSNSIAVNVNSLPTAPTASGTNTIAVGGSTILTSNSATGNIWSNGATTQSITVTTPGIYSVRYFNGTCTSVASNAITVNLNVSNYNVSTFAGNGTSGFTNGTGTAATFNGVNGITFDADGNLYVVDRINYAIRKITPAGVVTTFAGGSFGSANGTGTGAQFSGTFGIVSDASGNLFVIDNNRVRKITPAGVVTTFAGSGSYGFANGTGTAATFNFPIGIAIDLSGNLYVSDNGNNAIRKITPSGVVSTYAGSGNAGFADGNANTAQFSSPYGVAVDFNGNVYVADQSNHRIRKINTEGVVSTLAGSAINSYLNGTGSAARFNRPTSLTVDGGGNLFVGELSNPYIRKVTPEGVVTTIAGNGTSGFADGIGTSAMFTIIDGIYVKPNGDIYASDRGNYRIRKLTPCTTPATPTITAYGPLTFCASTPTVLTSSAATGNLWSNGETTQSITVMTPGAYTVRAISGVCTSDVSSSVTTNIIPTGTWLGTTTDWNNTANWCGGVPTATTDITLPSNGTLPAITGTIATCRNLTIPAGVTLNIGSGANFNLVGNLSGLGNIAGVSGSSLSLVGTTSQTIQRVNVGTLVVNNSAGVTLGGNVSLSNGITLTNGILNTGNNNLILLPNATSPTETANSYIIGNIRSNSRMIGTGSGSMFGITIAAGTDNLDTVMIERGENPATYNGNQGIGHIWKIRAGNQPVSGRQITLSWNARADNGKDLTNLQVYRRPDTGGEWIRMGSLVNGSSRSITLTTNSFSDWTVSDGNAPLPVTLTSFIGRSTVYGNQLTWTTSSEVNNQGFNVEQSTDGKTFTKIGFVKGNGTTNTKQTYQFTDVNSTEAYYRLQQVDFDGKTEYSATIKVGERTTATQLDVFPNPATNQVTIQTNGEGTLEIVNVVGKVVITQIANTTNDINISKLARGVYTVKFNGVSQKLVVR